MVRAVGIDLGSKRIGVSLSDSNGTLATPYEVVERTRDRVGDHRRLRLLVEEAEAEIVVVGLPLSLDGSMGPQARKYRAEAAELERRIGVPVVVHDERFTTVTGERALMEAGLDGRKRRQVIDKVAAAVMLQDWLDGRAAGSAEVSPNELDD